MSDSYKVGPLARSDALLSFRKLLSNLAALEPIYRTLVRVEVVIDATMVQRELRWRLRWRKKPDARSALQEAIDSGTLVAFAPPHLRREIEEHISDIAEYARVPEHRVVEEWHKFALHLHFYEPDSEVPQGSNANCVDPDDLPYTLVRRQLGARAVYTADPHFETMREPVIGIKIDLLCRDYARAASVEVGLVLGSGFTLMLSLQTLLGLAKFCIQTFKSLPLPVKAGLVFAVVFAIAHPECRKRVLDVLQSIWSQLRQPKSPVRAILAELVGQFVNAQQNRSKCAAEIKATLSRPKRRSAVALARAICLVNKAPLLLSEIERRMRNEGYVSRSPNFTKYLRGLLRAESRFREISPGSWTLHAAESSTSGTIGQVLQPVS